MALTRREGTMIGIIMFLLLVLFAQWIGNNIDKALMYQKGQESLQGQTIQGPNPDGSWGRYAEPMVQVKGVAINKETNEATIALIINVGSDENYLAYTTLPLDTTAEEAE